MSAAKRKARRKALKEIAEAARRRRHGERFCPSALAERARARRDRFVARRERVWPSIFELIDRAIYPAVVTKPFQPKVFKK